MLKGQIVFKDAKIVTDFKKPHIEFPHIYLESIFYNMISNSLKYTREDVSPVLEISSRLEYGKTILTFKDNGLGINLKEHGHNMFKLNKVFHSGFDSKGVGLFMTKTQIETFGGSITVESEVGVGTTFTIIL
jgi:signal transduction histidine kinase